MHSNVIVMKKENEYIVKRKFIYIRRHISTVHKNLKQNVKAKHMNTP